MKDIKMDKGSNTILLFTKQRAAFDYLSDEDAGKLIKAIYAYADEGTIPNFFTSSRSGERTHFEFVLFPHDSTKLMQASFCSRCSVISCYKQEEQHFVLA